MKFSLYSKIWANITYFSFFILLIFVFLNKLINPYLGYKLTYLFSLLFLIVTFIFWSSIIIILLQFLICTPHKDYEASGDLCDWYNERLNLLGTDWCIAFIDKLCEYLPSCYFSFLSPSANLGTYEKVMFNHISKTHTVNFYISDLAKLDKYETNVLGASNFSYYSQIDATNIFSVINTSVEVIFDMKGALWHVPIFKKKKLLKYYWENLTSNGLLIIDSSKESYINITFSHFKYYLCKFLRIKTSMRKEPSTFQRLFFYKHTLHRYFEPIDELILTTKADKPIKFKIYKKNI